MATSQCALDLIALEVPLDERAMRLLDKEAMNLAERPDSTRVNTRWRSCGATRHSLDQARERRLKFDANLVPSARDFLANGHEDSRAALSQAETRQTIDLDGARS